MPCSSGPNNNALNYNSASLPCSSGPNNNNTLHYNRASLPCSSGPNNALKNNRASLPCSSGPNNNNNNNNHNTFYLEVPFKTPKDTKLPLVASCGEWTARWNKEEEYEGAGRGGNMDKVRQMWRSELMEIRIGVRGGGEGGV